MICRVIDTKSVILVSKKLAQYLFVLHQIAEGMKVLSVGAGKLICKHFIAEAGAIRKDDKDNKFSKFHPLVVYRVG